MLSVMQKMQVNFVIKTLKDFAREVRKQMFAEIGKVYCIKCGDHNTPNHACKD